MMRKLFSYKILVATAIILSITAASILFIVNKQLSVRYFEASGKTRALFGITELTFIPYKIYSSILIVLSLMLLFFTQKKERGRWFWIAPGFSVLCLIMVFVRFWKWFV